MVDVTPRMSDVRYVNSWSVFMMPYYRGVPSLYAGVFCGSDVCEPTPTSEELRLQVESTKERIRRSITSWRASPKPMLP